MLGRMLSPCIPEQALGFPSPVVRKLRNNFRHLKSSQLPMDPSNKNIFSCFIMDLGKSPSLLFCFLFVLVCLLVWVCTVCKQVPEEAGVGAWNPGTVVPGSWKPRNMGAGNPTLVF